EMNSDAPISAISRSKAMLTSSLRWTRAIPRFQFGSHCDVIEASAERITPIKTIAMSASIRVKPRAAARLFRPYLIMRYRIIGPCVAAVPFRDLRLPPKRIGHGSIQWQESREIQVPRQRRHRKMGKHPYASGYRKVRRRLHLTKAECAGADSRPQFARFLQGRHVVRANVRLVSLSRWGHEWQSIKWPRPRSRSALRGS